VLSKNFDAYWATDDTTTTASLVFDLPQKQTFNLILLQEYIPLGQRVAHFSVERWDDAAAAWKPLADATTIGYKRILRLPATTAGRIRVNVLHALACPVLSTVGLYSE
jgi:alpha-L-fucosidase